MKAIIFIILTIFMYVISTKIYRKFKSPLLNPMLLSSVFIIIILKLFSISYDTYNIGGSYITMFLGCMVTVLAISLYNNKDALLKNFIPIICGVFSGIITSFVSVIALCKIFRVDNEIILSLLSKSITTPMAVESTKILGASESITIIAVIITGIMGAIISPIVIKFSGVKSDIAKGIGIGTSSHAVGTSKAVDMGDEVGAASGLAIAVTGILTVICVIILKPLILWIFT